MLVTTLHILSCLCSTTIVLALPAASNGPIVDLGYSKYQGTSLENGVSQWLGIRFAAPPVGNLRFRVAQDPIRNDTLQIADQV
jgi:hypothetical protein